MKKRPRNILLIIVFVLIGLPLFGYLGLYAIALHRNMNPDHVNLQKGGWVKLMHFTTDAKTDKHKTLVEIYGKSTKEPNSGGFVIVRPGLLPLGISAISPIYDVDHLWDKELTYNNGHGDSITGSIQVFDINLGYYFGRQVKMPKFNSTPSMQFSFYCKYGTNEYLFSGICYINCDLVPVFVLPYSKCNGPIFSTKKTGIYFDCDIKKYFPYTEEK
jgi:hypothetical protein